jgi:hypothetical protein
MTNTTTNLTIGLIALATLAGCKNKQHLQGDVESEMNQPMFEDEKAPRATSSILETQRARGAAADGYLYAAHFDGEQLNALGQAKLEAIVAGTPVHQPVAVNLNLPEGGEMNAAREEAVIAWLGEHEIAADRVQVAIGVNETSRHLSSFGTGGMYETKEGTIRAAKPQITEESSGGGEADKGMSPFGAQK